MSKSVSLLQDVVIAIGRSQGQDPAPPGPEGMRALAAMIDESIASPTALEVHVRALEVMIPPLHAKLLKADPSAGVERIPYLRPLSEDVIESIVSAPLAGRTDEELRRLRIDLLAVNAPALEGLHDDVFDEMPDAWLDMIDAAEDRAQRQRGEHTPLSENLADQLGLTPQLDEAALLRAADDPGAHAMSLPPTTLRIDLDALPDSQVRLRDTAGLKHAFLRLESSGPTLKVMTGGFLFVTEGCTLTVRWLQTDGLTLNGEEAPVDRAAVATIRDHDVPLTLNGRSWLLPGQWLEVHFERAGGFEVHTKVEIPSPFKDRGSR